MVTLIVLLDNSGNCAYVSNSEKRGKETHSHIRSKAQTISTYS